MVCLEMFFPSLNTIYRRMSFLQKYETINLGYKHYTKILFSFGRDYILFTLYELKAKLLTFIA